MRFLHVLGIVLLSVGITLGAVLAYTTVRSNQDTPKPQSTAITSEITPPSAPSPLTTASPAPSLTDQPLILNGTIEGSLGYPGAGIPTDMNVCAQNQETSEVFCTQQIKEDSFQYSVGYRLTVKPGVYTVWAQLPSDPSYRAYYSEFVTCGLHVECTSHEPIPVVVQPGANVKKVDPIDWYNR
jgi:hypothetical protein